MIIRWLSRFGGDEKALWILMALVYSSVGVLAVTNGLHELLHLPYSDPRNIAIEAIRLDNAGSINEAIFVLQNPYFDQPPLRSIPIFLIWKVIPVDLTFLGIVGIYEVFWRVCLLFTGLLLSLYVTVRSSIRKGVITAPLIGVLILHVTDPNLLYQGWPFMATLPAVAGILIADTITRTESKRRRDRLSVALAVAIGFSFLIDFEPAVGGLVTSSMILVVRNDPYFREWLTAGASGAVLLLPMAPIILSMPGSTMDQIYYSMKLRTVRQLFIEEFARINTVFVRYLVAIFGLEYILKIKFDGEITDLTKYAVAGAIVILPLKFLLSFDHGHMVFLGLLIVIADSSRCLTPIRPRIAEWMGFGTPEGPPHR